MRADICRAVFYVRESQYFTFACTHLDYTNTQERQVQVKKLNEVLLPKPYPVIVCGDFNAKPDSEEIDKGMAAWKRVCSPDFTISAKNPKSKIDYIFCYPPNRWKSIDAVTYRVPYSDHLPISATVELE